VNKLSESAAPTGTEPLVSKETIAKTLGVCTRYVGKLGEEKRIPAYKLGRRCVRYRVSEVLAALGIEP